MFTAKAVALWDNLHLRTHAHSELRRHLRSLSGKETKTKYKCIELEINAHTTILKEIQEDACKTSYIMKKNRIAYHSVWGLSEEALDVCSCLNCFGSRANPVK